MLNVREFAKRSLVPTAAISVLESRFTTTVRAGVLRATNRQVRAEFYFAFDDPYSALALPEVVELCQHRSVELSLFPVIDRGVDGDSVNEMRRRYAVKDASRLARRRQRELSRTEPIDAALVTTWAHWAEAARDRGALQQFSLEILRRVWFRRGAGVDFGEAYALYGRAVGSPPPKNLLKYQRRLAANSARLRQRGHWDSPALWVEGKWFFAHERLPHAALYMAALGAS